MPGRIEESHYISLIIIMIMMCPRQDLNQGLAGY
jgi:hypothetical protein